MSEVQYLCLERGRNLRIRSQDGSQYLVLCTTDPFVGGGGPQTVIPTMAPIRIDHVIREEYAEQRERYPVELGVTAASERQKREDVVYAMMLMGVL